MEICARTSAKRIPGMVLVLRAKSGKAVGRGPAIASTPADGTEKRNPYCRSVGTHGFGKRTGHERAPCLNVRTSQTGIARERPLPPRGDGCPRATQLSFPATPEGTDRVKYTRHVPVASRVSKKRSEKEKPGPLAAISCARPGPVNSALLAHC